MVRPYSLPPLNYRLSTGTTVYPPSEAFIGEGTNGGRTVALAGPIHGNYKFEPMRENAGSALDGTWDGFWQWIPDSAWPSIVLHVQFQTLEQKNRFDRYNFNSYIMEHCDRYPNTLGKSPTAIFEKGLQGLNTSPLASSKEHFGDIVTQTFNFYGSPKYPPTPFLASEFIGDHDVGLNFPFWRQKEKWSQGSITGVSSSTATGVGSSYPHIPPWTMLNRTSGESTNNTDANAEKYGQNGVSMVYPCNWVKLIQDSALH